MKYEKALGQADIGSLTKRIRNRQATFRPPEEKRENWNILRSGMIERKRSTGKGRRDVGWTFQVVECKSANALKATRGRDAWKDMISNAKKKTRYHPFHSLTLIKGALSCFAFHLVLALIFL